MEIFISFAAKVAEYTVEPIGRQAGYLLCYKGYFKELADHVEELEAEREIRNHSIEEGRRNGLIIYVAALNWMKEVNEVIQKANNLQTDPRHAKVGCSGWSFPNFILRHQLSRQATKIAKEAVEVKGKGKFDPVGYLPPPGEVAFSNSSATNGGVTVKLETRESFKEGIVKALKDPSAHNIGVYGLGGVGKTTLVEEVYEIAKQQKLFDVVVMVINVSKTPDIKKIQEVIADQLVLRFQEETVAWRANRLRQRIKAEKTILIILDDIWPSFEFKKVGIPSGDLHKAHVLDKQNTIQNVEQNACKLLMTSRNKGVLLEKEVQEEFTFRLDLLSEAESWRLFQSMVGHKVNDIHIQKVATEVAQKCAGLPLCIVTVASGLKNKDIHFWKDALRVLKNVGLAEMDKITNSALELCYNWLVNDEMKEFFLLSAVLQGSDAEWLLKVVIGLDIFKQIYTVEEARNRLQNMIGSLKASCLLHEGNTSGQIQMHDSIREVAISIASRVKHAFVVKPKDGLKWPTNDFLKSCSQIILYYCHIPELPQRLDCPNVKLFILVSANRSLEIPDTFFEGMGSLKVLDLSYLNLPSLPASFRSLISLQTLCLDQCILENIDAIQALKNLEILSLRSSSMTKLPSEIGKLAQLRMLDLSHSGIEVIPPNIISSLTKLEELYMGNTSIKWEDEISANQNENASLAELRQLSNLKALELQIREAWILPRDLQLQRYKIAIGDVRDWSDIKDGTLKTLMLKLGTNIDLEHGIKALIKGVENLYLDEVEGIQNVLYQLNWEGFPSLKHLHIQNNAKMKHIVNFMERNRVPDSFLNLETLVLQNLKNLEQICHGPIAVNSFGKLSVIKVKNCIQLKYLLSFSMVEGLSRLSEIQVCECNSMKEIMLGDNDSSEVNDITNEIIEFPSLHSLTLEHLPILENFSSYEPPAHSITERKYQRWEKYVPSPFFGVQVALPNLDTLKLSSLNLNKIWDDNRHSAYKLTNLIFKNCGELKYLFSSTMVGSFINLKRLEISKCPLMEEIIATEERNSGTSALKEVRFSKLEEIIMKDMENLKTVWHHQFDTLKTLQVNNCGKIMVVFPSSMQKTYNNLEKLEVTDCASVEEIFELSCNEKGSTEDATNLKVITLSELPKLKNTWSRDPQGILSFPNLETVHLFECGSLEHLFPLSVATCCSHLETLRIIRCRNMKEIVAGKKGSTCTASMFEFNRLSTLVLWGLVKLKGFYAGNHTLSCPTLRTINVAGCLKLNLFKTSFTSILGRSQNGKYSIVEEEPLFIFEKVIPDVEDLIIDYRDAKMILQEKNLGALFTKIKCLRLNDYRTEEATFPYWFIRNVRTLEDLVVGSSSFKKIFPDARLGSEKSYARLKKLELQHLPELQHICEEGCQIDPVLEDLEHLHVHECRSLTKLSPSSATFNHLTCLQIDHCNGLIRLITSPTARSLAKLTTMKVKNCNSLEEIITGKEDVDIGFPSLEILTLEYLPRLNKFGSSKCLLKFPLLEEVVVRECPRMKIFSEGNTRTPNLRKVKIAEDDG